MASLNSVHIIGRLGADPDVRVGTSGTMYGNMRVAVDDSYTKDGERVERTEWVTVSLFGRTAENCQRFLGKGSLVFVSGRLRTRKWQDRDGQDRYSTEVAAELVQFLDRRENNGEGQQERPQGQRGNSQPRGGQSRPQGNRGGSRQQQPQDDQDLGPAFPSDAAGMDDIPFAFMLAPLAALIASLMGMPGVV